MARYLGRLASKLGAGTMTIRAASERAVQTVVSGPAAGVLAGAWIGVG
jgi:N-methylhydantoinase A/oxoprolinase/acetone carboxylase beta subunit